MVTLADNVGKGRGLYTMAEAAFYSRMPLKTMKRWIEGSRVGERVIRPDAWRVDEKFLTYADFVQSLAIRSIRSSQEVSVPLQKIRAAVNSAAEKYGVEHPFARRHVTYWDGRDIHIELIDGILTQITGKKHGQGAFKPLIELYLEDLVFDDDGLAKYYRAFSWDGVDVGMDPKVRFGEPQVASTGYTAEALWTACFTEGSIEAGALAYGVTRTEAESACRYYDFLQGKAA